MLYSNDGVSYDAVCTFRKLFAAATGITLEMKWDFMVQRGGHEIVFGKTDREDIYTVDFDSLASDAFVLALSGERLFIAAASAAGYNAAFAEFFKQSLGIEDIEMIIKSDKIPALPEGFEMITEPSVKLEPNKTASGISYSVEGAENGSYNYYRFSDTITYYFNTPIGKKFNSYSISYSTEAYLKGEITYLYDGATYTEKFFLEPGQNMSFTSLFDNALKGNTADSVSSLKFTLLSEYSTSLCLEDIAVSARKIPTSDVAYISDGRYKLGVKLTWGGGVSYLEDLADGDHTIKNLLNNHDTGRLVQQSYYGTSSAPYVPAKYNGSTWAYNPVQGGDQYGNHSKLVDFSISEDGRSIWVKCQPLDWAQKKSYTPSYMENTYTIADGHIKVDNRFTDFSGYTHRNVHQELPAFYTISYLSDFVFYNGSNAWKDDDLTVKTDLPFWAGNSNAYFNMKSRETWCAWVAPTGYGVGVYTPIAEILLAGRYSYNGSKNAHSNATNYVAPLITHTLKTFDTFEYSYYITTGSVEEIRSTFKELSK